MTRGAVRPLACAYALLLTAALAVDAHSLEQPPTLTPEGGVAVPKVSEARRADLLGAVELYSVALYAEGAAVEIFRLTSPDSTKALRIAIGFKEELDRRVLFDWRRELVPRLDSAAAADANHDLMLQFLEHWIGQRSVSEEIKQQLMGAPGAGLSSPTS